MNARIISCRPAKNYTLWLRFSDGLQGSVDLSSLLDIGCFKFWRDLHVFLDVQPCPKTGDAVWPAGVRLNAEVLYQDIAARGGRRAPAPSADAAFQRFMARAIGAQDGPADPHQAAEETRRAKSWRRAQATRASWARRRLGKGKSHGA